MQFRTYIWLLLIRSVATALDSLYPSPTLVTAGKPNLGSVRGPHTTEPPIFNEEIKLLLARQQAVTCGYFDGDSARPNTCTAGSICLFDQDTHYFACRLEAEGVQNVTQCNTWDGYLQQATASLIAGLGGDIVTCGSVYSLCQTTYFPSVPGFPGPYTHYDCLPTTSAIQYLSQDPVTPSVSVSVSTVSPSVSISVQTNAPTVSVSYSVQTLSPSATLSVLTETVTGPTSSQSRQGTTTTLPEEEDPTAASTSVSQPSEGGTARESQGKAAGIMVLAIIAVGAM